MSLLRYFLGDRISGYRHCIFTKSSVSIIPIIAAEQAIYIIFQQNEHIKDEDISLFRTIQTDAVNGGGGCGEDAALSYWHTPGSEPLRYLTLGQVTTLASKRWPDREVFVSLPQQTRLTFRECENQANELAAGLLDMGLTPGDRIAICSPNSVQWFLTALAASKAGLVLVSLNPNYLTSELQYCLAKVQVRALVIDESFRSQNYYEMMCEIVPELRRLQGGSNFFSEALPNLKYLIVNSDKNLPGTYRLKDVMKRTSSLLRLKETQQGIRPEHCGNIQLTSGTTGRPKAVPLSHFNLINNSYCFGKRLGLNKKHFKILAQSPFFHVLGYIGALIASLQFGATCVLPSPAFSVAHSCDAIAKEKCSVLVGTPTMYVDLCGHLAGLSADQRALYQAPEVAVSGGALCLPELFRKMKSTFDCDRVVSVYGLTETTAIIFQSSQEDSEYHMTSTVGKVAEHVEAKVVDPDGLSVPLGTPGELWIRSYNNMKGYWQDPESTGKIKTQDGWLKTGDKFILLEGGYGQVVGRIKDMIIRGGENISPKEVEELLVTHPDVLDAQVYGVTSERLGEDVACSLRLKEGVSDLTLEEVKNFCNGKIARFKIPVFVEIVDEYPKTGSGKVQKFKLRKAMEKKLEINK